MVGLEKVRRAPLAVALSLFGLCGFIALPVAPSHAAPAVISAIPEPPETLEAYPADFSLDRY